MSKQRPTTARVLSLPVEPHTRRRTRAAGRTPSSDYLTSYRTTRGVHWIAVDLAAVSEILAAATSAGIEFSDRLALVDLHAAIERGTLRPFRYYAKRWRWSERRTRTLFEREELLAARASRSKRGTQQGHAGDTGSGESGEDSIPGDTRGTQEAHSIEQRRGDREKGARAPSISDPPTGKKKRPAPRPDKRDERAREAQRIAGAIVYPAELDTPEVRLEFARWIYFRLYIHKKKLTFEDPAGVVDHFQMQIDRAVNNNASKYYIAGGAAGYIAALVLSRAEQWQAPYPDKDFEKTLNPDRPRRDLSHVPLI